MAKQVTAPRPEDFQFRGVGVQYGDQTDWSAYNRAVQQFNYGQEQGRYDEGRKLLSDVAKLFGDTGAYDQSYRNAKNQYMAKSASDMVSRGMGNLVNTPAMDLAYEREVRPEFEMQKQSRLAQAMSTMAQYMGSYSPQFAPQGVEFSRIGAGNTGGSGYSPFSMGSMPQPPGLNVGSSSAPQVDFFSGLSGAIGTGAAGGTPERSYFQYMADWFPQGNRPLGGTAYLSSGGRVEYANEPAPARSSSYNMFANDPYLANIGPRR